MENKRFFTYTAIAACMICAIAVAFNVFTDLNCQAESWLRY